MYGNCDYVGLMVPCDQFLAEWGEGIFDGRYESLSNVNHTRTDFFINCHTILRKLGTLFTTYVSSPKNILQFLINPYYTNFSPSELPIPNLFLIIVIYYDSEMSKQRE